MPDAAGPTRSDGNACRTSPHAVFAWCPACDGPLAPEHAHYRCTECGWRDSCCD